MPKTNGDNGSSVPMKPLSITRVEGGNLLVELDVDDYKKGVEELRFSVVGRNHLQKGSSAPTTMELRRMLASTWGFDTFKLLPMGVAFSMCC